MQSGRFHICLYFALLRFYKIVAHKIGNCTRMTATEICLVLSYVGGMRSMSGSGGIKNRKYKATEQLLESMAGWLRKQ